MSTGSWGQMWQPSLYSPHTFGLYGPEYRPPRNAQHSGGSQGLEQHLG